MSLNHEVSRLDSGQSLAALPGAGWFYEIQLGMSADAVIDKIKAAVHQIVSVSAEAWPSDDEWRLRLPPWLLKVLPVMSREECQKLIAKTPKNLWHTLPWEYGSWLDAIKFRNWRWWGYSVRGSQLNLVLEILSEPAGLEAFEVIVKAAGGIVARDHRMTARDQSA